MICLLKPKIKVQMYLIYWKTYLIIHCCQFVNFFFIHKDASHSCNCYGFHCHGYHRFVKRNMFFRTALGKVISCLFGNLFRQKNEHKYKASIFFPRTQSQDQNTGTGVHLQKVCLVKVWSRAPQFDLIKRSWHAEFPWGRVLYRNHLSSTGTVCIPTLIVPSVSRKVAIRQLPKIIPDRFHPSSSEKSAVPIELVNYVRG